MSHKLTNLVRVGVWCTTVSCSQITFASACLAQTNAGSLPVYNQLLFGDGPGTNDAATSKQSNKNGGTGGIDLTPITPEAKSSVHSKIPNGRIRHNAQMTGVELGPLRLRETDEEVSAKKIKLVDSEKVQLMDLWDATLSNNPDIQFVIQRLTPTSDENHKMASITKMLSTMMYGAVTIGSVAIPNSAGGSSTLNKAGVQMIQSALSGVHSNSHAKTPLSESEAVMLYNVVRNVAEKLADNFHDYRKHLSSRDMAQQDLQDLRSIVTSASAELSVKDKIELEYFLRKASREIAVTENDLERSRQTIVDLAGSTAATKLDLQIDIEMAKVGNGTEIDSQATSDH